jgi:diguanylate cyclase (GGDEF)-like protein
MECKFLDSYEATLNGDQVKIWYCRKRDPFVLGASKEVALATCSSCRLSDFTRPPAELAFEVERRNQELVALNAIVSAVNSSLDLDTLLDMGLDKVMEILQVDAGWIALDDGLHLRVACHRGISAPYAQSIHRLSRSDGVVGKVYRDQETVIIDDVHSSEVTLPATRREGLATMLALPLKAQGRMLGVLSIATRQARAYSADDIYFATAASAQLASAIEHALLFREQLDRIERQHSLLEAAETVNRSLDTHSIELTILAEAARLVGAQKSALLVVRGDVLVAQNVYRLSETYRHLFVVPLNDSVSGRAVVIGETVAVDDVDQEPQTDAYLVAEGRYKAYLTAPLESYKGTNGALSVFYDDVHHFSGDEKTLLRTFAIQAAIALDNQRLMVEKDQMAVRDGLTGVYNRSYLELAIERTTKELRRNGGSVSILFLDVDDMKRVNDTHGHQAGDRLLRELAALLGESCRDSDIVARYGGDEFVVLMPGTDDGGARRVGRKIEDAIVARNASAGGAVTLSASLGMHTVGEADIDDLLHEADRRMYAMKRGRSRD